MTRIALVVSIQEGDRHDEQVRPPHAALDA
jgi:hypothetical protein